MLNEENNQTPAIGVAAMICGAAVIIPSMISLIFALAAVGVLVF